MEAWYGMWDQDGLVHVIGRYVPVNGVRTMHGECGVQLQAVYEGGFLNSNTIKTTPTCIACWHASNFGSYSRDARGI